MSALLQKSCFSGVKEVKSQKSTVLYVLASANKQIIPSPTSAHPSLRFFQRINSMMPVADSSPKLMTYSLSTTYRIKNKYCAGSLFLEAIRAQHIETLRDTESIRLEIQVQAMTSFISGFFTGSCFWCFIGFSSRAVETFST